MTVPTSLHPPTLTAPSMENVQPQQDHISLALKAMDESRWSDAAKHTAAIPETPLCAYAWKMYLNGWLAAEQLDFTSAETTLLQAASAALVNGLGVEQKVESNSLCLAAAAMEKLGVVYRREERFDDAYRIHLVAYHLRREHGSFDEQWEIAMNLAIDRTVVQRYEEAQRWCSAAIDLATHVSEHPFARQAQAWSRQSRVLTSLGQHDDAVAAARTAREYWRKHDQSAVTAARADLNLAHALMKNGESVYETDAAATRRLLEEALKLLATAAVELPPFGPEAAVDVRLCAEQIDFAQRLLASLSD